MKMPTLPKEILLTSAEREQFLALVRTDSSTMQFWLRAFAARGLYPFPKGRLPCMSPVTFGHYRVEWNAIRLGPQAIAEGTRYRQYTEKKNRDFSERLAKRGLEVWH